MKIEKSHNNAQDFPKEKTLSDFFFNRRKEIDYFWDGKDADQKVQRASKIRDDKATLNRRMITLFGTPFRDTNRDNYITIDTSQSPYTISVNTSIKNDSSSIATSKDQPVKITETEEMFYKYLLDKIERSQLEKLNRDKHVAIPCEMRKELLKYISDLQEKSQILEEVADLTMMFLTFKLYFAEYLDWFLSINNIRFVQSYIQECPYTIDALEYIDDYVSKCLDDINGVVEKIKPFWSDDIIDLDDEVDINECISFFSESYTQWWEDFLNIFVINNFIKNGERVIGQNGLSKTKFFDLKRKGKNSLKQLSEFSTCLQSEKKNKKLSNCLHELEKLILQDVSDNEITYLNKIEEELLFTD